MSTEGPATAPQVPKDRNIICENLSVMAQHYRDILKILVWSQLIVGFFVMVAIVVLFFITGLTPPQTNEPPQNISMAAGAQPPGGSGPAPKDGGAAARVDGSTTNALNFRSLAGMLAGMVTSGVLEFQRRNRKKDLNEVHQAMVEYKCHGGGQ